MAEKTRYSDDELEEFRDIILAKLDKAKKDYEILKSSITHEESNDTMDTSPTFKVKRGGWSSSTTSAEIHSAPAGCTGKDRKQNLRHLPRDRETYLKRETQSCTPCNTEY
jgi:hypothetical protein